MDHYQSNLALIRGLSPQRLLEHFAAISGLDRGSGREKKLANNIMRLAAERRLNCYIDTASNVVVYVPASLGKENVASVCLQSHLDMVAINSEEKDFDTSTIEFDIENGKLRAEGTSLGADNGIGVAAMLCFLTDRELVHGPLELLFTTSEEVGLDGARTLAPEAVSSKFLLNLDSEAFGEVTVGCAGGGRIEAVFDIESIELNDRDRSKLFEIYLKDFRGGHSGMEIAKGQANAIVSMARLLGTIIEKWPHSRLISFDGGSRMNAIPAIAKSKLAVIGDVSGADIGTFIRNKFLEIVTEYSPLEDKATLEIVSHSGPVDKKYYPRFFSAVVQKRLITMLQLIPCGVIRLDPKDPQTVQTSNNLALISTVEDKVTITCMYRSSSDTLRSHLGDLLARCFQHFGPSEIIPGAEYSSWPRKYDSRLLELAQKTFRSRFIGQEMKVVTVHGGLECAEFIKKWPDMDIISFGPTIDHPHTVNEEANLLSVDSFWNYLVEFLADFNLKAEKTK